MRNRLSVVTGAGGGIGRAAVRRFLKKGWDVAALYRTVESAAAHTDQLAAVAADAAQAATAENIRPVVADVRNRQELVETLGLLGTVDAVVANAGICRQAAMGNGEAHEVWREVMACNLDGVFNTISAVLPNMDRGGRIVVVSSGLGKVGRAGYSAYSASKHGVLGMMKCLARELAPRKITVNAVCPGWVDTPMAQNDLKATAAALGSTPAQVRAQAVDNIPLGRFVEPEEVAALIDWLCSEEADAITGQTFNISCGELAA